MDICVTSKVSIREKKIAAGEHFHVRLHAGLVLTSSLITTIYAFFVFCLWHLCIRIKGLYWSNLDNLLLSHPINRLCIHWAPSPFVLCSLVFSLASPSHKHGLVHLWIAEHQGFPVLESIPLASPPELFSRSHRSTPLISRCTARLSKAKAGAPWRFLAGSSLHKAH